MVVAAAAHIIGTWLAMVFRMQSPMPSKVFFPEPTSDANRVPDSFDDPHHPVRELDGVS